MDQPGQTYPGVRAEPRFLRDPTSFESISSGLHRFSSYVASNLPKRKPSIPSAYPDWQASAPSHLTYQQQQQQPPQSSPSLLATTSSAPSTTPLEDAAKQDPEDDSEKVTFATFQTMESAPSEFKKSRNCLLLGYSDGFQVWDVSNPDNIHELCSIRDENLFGTVSSLHLLDPPLLDGENEHDAFADQRPLLAVISTRDTASETDSLGSIDLEHVRKESGSSLKTSNGVSSLRIYSLKSQSVVKEITSFGDDDDETRITSIKSNHNVVVLGCVHHSRSSIQILSATDLELAFPPLTDVYHDYQGPVFALGSRFLAYGTSNPVLNADPTVGPFKGISGTSLGMLQGEKDVKGAAKDIAKEVVSGVKSLSEYGYQTLSNYFANPPIDTKMYPPPQPQQHQPQQHQQPQQRRHSRAGSVSPRATSPVSIRAEMEHLNTPSSPNAAGTHRKAPSSGMILVRDIMKLPKTSTRNLSSSTVAHFRPHSHPLSCLAFNSAGTLLLSASKQGHTFHIFSILPSGGSLGNIAHLYSLARGYTDAQVEDCRFTADSMWCAVSTARGTTHVYAINPYGGNPEILGHVTGKVNNPVYRLRGARKLEKGTSLGSVARIKQRRSMQLDPLEDANGSSPLYPSPGRTQPPLLQPQPRVSMRAKIASSFLATSKVPYLANASTISKGAGGTGSSFFALKQQASSLGSMLSSFGSSISSNESASSLSSRPHPPSQQQQWTSANDRITDNRLFGFDEEETPPPLDDESNKSLLGDGPIGHQDIYSFHPCGVLTLHRCWISRNVVRKREQTRTVEKLDLSVKQEDVAEWHMARAPEWEEVKVPLAPTQVENKHRRPWLSHAEIMTYNAAEERPLWSWPQFSFQTYKDKNEVLSRKIAMGEVPATSTVVVRRDMPEPYSSRVDRVNKTVSASQGDESNLDDAVAELESNLSKAMQTSFANPTPLSSSPANFKRLSPGSGMGVARSSPSTISFEDAHLISMGSGPSPEDLLHKPAPMSSTPLHHSSLIHFEDDDDALDPAAVGSSPLLQGAAGFAFGSASEDMDQVFSPDGDNEVANPSESIFVERRS